MPWRSIWGAPFIPSLCVLRIASTSLGLICLYKPPDSPPSFIPQISPLEGSYTFNEINPLECDAVLLDEAAMLDVTLAAAFLKALKVGTQVVLVGKFLPCHCGLPSPLRASAQYFDVHLIQSQKERG